jgi:lipooligosaccharide transport system ATP-binding protein
MSGSVITVRDISKSFGAVRAVAGLSFTVAEGSCFGFLGPNGAGKTTMMKMIYARSPRDADCGGTMEVFGYDPRREELEIKYLAGVVPQEDSLDDELNVGENLMVYSRFYDMARAEARERIEELLLFLELSEKREAKIRELSGGMKRRLIIARALLNKPRLLILDEPTTGLDPQVRHLIWDKLRQLKRQGVTILLTTHYMEEAYQLCDRIIIMDRGREVMQGRPRELLRANIEEFVLETEDREAAGKVSDAAVRVDSYNEVVRLYSNSLEKLKAIAESTGSVEYVLRQSNLEDVFLKTTGRSLNVEQ